MDTRIFGRDEINDKVLRQAAAVIKDGGLVAFPTETVYGLGADGLNPEAVAKIYQAKGRPSDNPLILHVASIKMLNEIVENLSDMALKIINAFWPGPLTLILPRRSTVPDCVAGSLPTVGVRMPNHHIALELIRRSERPIAAPSANTSGRPSPTTAQAVAADLYGKIDVILDGGSSAYGLESTILDCSSAETMILRPGAITREMLERVAGPVELDRSLFNIAAAPKAPGMKYTHYAPKAPMMLFEGEPERVVAKMKAMIEYSAMHGKCIGVIVSEETAAQLPDTVKKTIYGKRDDLSNIGKNLYEALRSFDNSNVNIIFGEGTPELGLGMAIMNRMHKACGFRVIQC